MANENIKKELVSWFLVILGSFLFAVGDIMFANPYNLAPGGTWGLSNVFCALAGGKVAVYVLIMDIPLLVIGTWILGPKFGVKTVAATIFNIIFALILEGTWQHFPVIQQGIYDMANAVDAAAYSALSPEFQSTLVEGSNTTAINIFGFTIREGVSTPFYFVPDYLLNTLVTGLIYGIAIGLIFRAGATSGGSDIVSMILHKYTKISLGTLVIIVDGIITFSTLLIGAFKGFDTIHDFTAYLRLPINSFIVVFIEGIMIDLVVDGFKRPKTYIVTTKQAQKVANFIATEMGKNAELGCAGDVVVCTMNHKDSTKLNIWLAQEDPEAFVTVLESKETYGKGYKALPTE